MEFIRWQQGATKLTAFGRTIKCICDVRNKLNGRRKDNEVVYTIPDHEPYQPSIFPKGTWVVGPPLARTDKYLAPYYIPTNAWQPVNVWETVKDERTDKAVYVQQTEQTVADKAYGLHYSESSTTLGCIKILNELDLIWLVNKINDAILHGVEVYLEVI